MADKIPRATAVRPTRFARLFSDGSISIEPAGTGFLEARKILCDRRDDPDTELLEIEISVVRTHGSPHIALIDDTLITCPTCGESIHDGEVTEMVNQLRRELNAAHAMLRMRRSPDEDLSQP